MPVPSPAGRAGSSRGASSCVHVHPSPPIPAPHLHFSNITKNTWIKGSWDSSRSGRIRQCWEGQPGGHWPWSRGLLGRAEGMPRQHLTPRPESLPADRRRLTRKAELQEIPWSLGSFSAPPAPRRMPASASGAPTHVLVHVQVTQLVEHLSIGWQGPLPEDVDRVLGKVGEGQPELSSGAGGGEPHTAAPPGPPHPQGVSCLLCLEARTEAREQTGKWALTPRRFWGGQTEQPGPPAAPASSCPHGRPGAWLGVGCQPGAVLCGPSRPSSPLVTSTKGSSYVACTLP